MHFERKESEGSITLKGCRWENREDSLKTPHSRTCLLSAKSCAIKIWIKQLFLEFCLLKIENCICREKKNWCISKQSSSCCTADVKMVSLYQGAGAEGYFSQPQIPSAALWFRRMGWFWAPLLCWKAVTSSPLPAPTSCHRAAPTEREGSSLPDLYRVCCFCLSWLPLPHAELVLEVIQLNCFLQLLALNWLFSTGSFKWCPRGSAEPEIPVNPGSSKMIEANRALISALGNDAQL